MPESGQSSSAAARTFEGVYSHEHELEAEHWWFASRLERILDLVRAHLPGSGARILDLGCGSGRTARRFESFGSVVGSDLSWTPLRDDARAGRRRLASRAERLPFRTGSFDLVTALDLVEHLEDDQPALREMLRVLRPGGVLIVTVPAMPILYGPHDRVLGHWRRYSSADLRRSVRRSGAAGPLQVGYFLSLLFPLLLAWRVTTKIFGAGKARSDGGRPLPRWANRLLRAIMDLEGALAARVPLGVGSTLVCVISPGPASRAP
ncbi:MAG: class I SAM-dependent methyltransferase [Planctomycetaceae bacterium]|nr:class I SAM-dependent methyltransferase [Planctomycetaceae bacterium]